ncbi:MAG: hypothetical protein AAFV95_11970 [Bacteroidota bacterium]
MSFLFILFAAIMAMVVLQRIRIIFLQYRCPSEDTLLRYFNGQLRKRDPDAYDRVVSHLGICETCQETLRRIDDNNMDSDISQHLINDEE